MSENQQPLDQEEEQAAPQAEAAAADEDAPVQEEESAALPDEAETETLPVEAGDNDLVSDEDDTGLTSDDQTDEEEEEPDIDPADVRILGLPRVCFQCAAFGVALGYIVCGLFGILAERMAGTTIGDLLAKTQSVTACAIIGGAIGYLIGRHLHKKRLAAREAEEAAMAAQQTDTEA